MGYCSDTLAARRIPELLRFADGTPVGPADADRRSAELRRILEDEIYGRLPPPPDYISGRLIHNGSPNDFAGKGSQKTYELTVSVSGKPYTFPFILAMPRGNEHPPFVVILNFREGCPDRYIPAEELIDRGIGFAVIHYKDVTSDDDDMMNGFSGLFHKPDGKRAKNDCGKIGMWAYAASRVLDYILAMFSPDPKRIAVAGHSRLGKTALVAAAFDPRFTCGYSNDSGCSGAAITRQKTGEHVARITEVFPYWFCPHYADYSDREDEMPFDQHFLIAAIAPRNVYVASALDDSWADPESEFLGCRAASEFWNLYGKTGFIADDRKPEAGDAFHEGDIGYHLRTGCHFFSRTDWNLFLDFFLKD